MKPLFLAFIAVNAATMGLLLAQAPPPPPLPAGIPAGNVVIMERRIDGPGMQDVQIQRSGPDGAPRGRGGPNGGANGGPTATGPTGPGGKVSGVVLDSITGQPLRKATVRLNKRGGPGGGGMVFTMGPGGPGGQGGLATTTNEEGKYNFDAVPAGDYFLSAERSGYIRGSYGARTPRSMGNTIQVKDEGDQFRPATEAVAAKLHQRPRAGRRRRPHPKRDGAGGLLQLCGRPASASRWPTWAKPTTAANFASPTSPPANTSSRPTRP